MLDSLVALVGTLWVRVRNQDAQTLAEYSILASLIAVVVIAGAVVFGASLTGLFPPNTTRV
jgi:Flp pilus assembly pilin Flp